MTAPIICAQCGALIDTPQDDDDARAEARANFGADVFERLPMAVVCDECYQAIMAALRDARS